MRQMAAPAEGTTGNSRERGPKGINERESPRGRSVILAIDVGTSGVKLALVSVAGDLIATEFEETRLYLLPNGGAEQNPDDWWHAIRRAARRALHQGKVARDDVAAISCTGQWSGTVAVDRTGNHLMNAIISMDSRGAPYIRQVTGGLIRFRGYGISKLLRWLRLTGGIPCHSGRDPIAHILYIKNELPDIYEDTYKFVEPKDYINLRLTGRCAASFDSVALHWVTDNRDIFNIAYDDRLIKMSTIDREKLPELRRATDILGPIKKEVAEELGLSERVRVVMGTPDVQAAAIGAGAVEDYVAHLYLGTSSWLTCHVPFKKTDLFHNIASLPSAVPGRYFVANEQETAGACLTFLRENILSDVGMSLTGDELSDVYETLDQIAPGRTDVAT